MPKTLELFIIYILGIDIFRGIKMKKIFMSFSLVTCILSMCSCSYSDIDNAINNKINDIPEADATIIDENGVERNVDNTPISYKGIQYVGIDETFSDYYSYTDEFDELQESGIKGLTYTLKNVSVYDSINDSPINPDDCRYKNFGETFDEIIKYNSFVLVEMTATYEKNIKSDSDMIQPILEFSERYHIGDGFKEFHPSTENDKLGKEEYTSIDPYIVYFSEQPIEGDKDINGNLIDINKSGNWFRTPLKNGESIDFQLGIVCSKELINDKNLFLNHRYETPPSDEPVYQIDLFGRLANAKNAQN